MKTNFGSIDNAANTVEHIILSKKKSGKENGMNLYECFTLGNIKFI